MANVYLLNTQYEKIIIIVNRQYRNNICVMFMLLADSYNYLDTFVILNDFFDIQLFLLLIFIFNYCSIEKKFFFNELKFFF